MKKRAPRPAAYLIGIKGVGMTMLAQFLKAHGQSVSGSDIRDVFLTDKILRGEKIKVLSPFDSANIPASPDKIIHSSAYSAANNPELAFIVSHPERYRKIPLITYAEALGEVFNRYQGVAVCGSHGKTTVTAWLGYVLWRAGLEPNVLVGSNVPQFRGSGLSGRSRRLIAEVDEYQNKMRFFFPRGVIMNNIDYDHPDFFKTRSSYVQVFTDFVRKIPRSGWLVVNGDDHQAVRVAEQCRGRVVSYSLSGSDADFLAVDIRQSGEKQIFRLNAGGRDQGEFSIKLSGRHNVSNALAVIAAARQYQISWTQIRRQVTSFRGTERRGEILGEYRGALIIDDYAHHPAEIKATLSGLRARWPKNRIITVFHPHTFTRTAALFGDFIRSFKDTDHLIVLGIYGSARETASSRSGGVTSAKLAAAIKDFNKREGIRQRVISVPTLDGAAARLRQILKKGDRVILMGAGDVFRIGTKLLK